MIIYNTTNIERGNGGFRCGLLSTFSFYYVSRADVRVFGTSLSLLKIPYSTTRP